MIALTPATIDTSTGKSGYVTTIRLTRREAQYARAVSRRLPGCPRPEVGSAAHLFKGWLREHARRNGVDIGYVPTIKHKQTKEEIAEAQKRWRSSDEGKASIRKTMRNRKLNNPNKFKANEAVRYAVWCGKLVKPAACE